MNAITYDVVELSSDCVCTMFDEETYQEVESDECFGCWQDSKDELEELIILPWLKQVDADNGDYVVARGENVGWMKLSGMVSFEVDYDDIVDDLVGWFSLNGDFRLSFRLDGHALSVRRGSHDEPMGANFELKIVKRKEVI